MFTTNDLIEQVRQAAMEFDTSPITDKNILDRLNRAYSFAYNILIKQNDSYFMKWKYLSVVPNKAIYELPKDMFSKRVERLYCAVPIADPERPITWVEVLRCDTCEIPNYETPRFQVFYPLRWTQFANKIQVAPCPNTSTAYRLLYTPALVPLGQVEGQITEITGNRLTLDASPSAELLENMGRSGHNIISICDEMTGEVKAIYPYNEVNGSEIFLSSNFNRATFRAKTVRACNKFVPATKITYDPITKLCTVLTNSNPSSYMKAGDTIEITRPASGKFNILDGLDTDADFYDPPEYELPQNTFSRSGVVSSVTANTISWLDTSVVPDFTNGYPTGFDDGTFTGLILAMGAGTYDSQSVVLCTCAFPHNLTIGRVFKLNVVAIGTDAGGVKKCIPTSSHQFVILQPTLSGIFTGGTWAMYQYAPIVIVDGWPEIYDVSPGAPKVDMLNLFTGTPYCYSAIPASNYDTPDPEDIVGNRIVGIYDHDKDIRPGDWVTKGYSTAVPHSVELLAEFLVFFCAITLKSAMNETDPEVAAVLKEKINELKSDTDGRNMMLRMEQTYRPGQAYNGRGRR